MLSITPPKVLNQIDFFMALSDLIERAAKTCRPVFLAIISVLPKSSTLVGGFRNEWELVHKKIIGMLKSKYTNGELIGFSCLTKEFSLATEITQADILQKLRKYVDEIGGFINAEFLYHHHFKLSFSYTLRIPDTTTFADNLIADARKSAHFPLPFKSGQYP